MKLSYRSRGLTYSFLLFGIVIILLFLVPSGILLGWSASVFAETTLSVLTGFSVFVLIIDKIWYDRPNFIMWLTNSPKTFAVAAGIKEHYIVCRIRNDGFREANSLKVRVSVLSNDFKQQYSELALLKLPTDRDGEEGTIKDLKTGGEIDAYFPVTSLVFDYGEKNVGEGVVRIRIITTFGGRYDFFSYKVEDNAITFNNLGKELGLDFFYELRFRIKNRTKESAYKVTVKLPAVRIKAYTSEGKPVYE